MASPTHKSASALKQFTADASFDQPKPRSRDDISALMAKIHEVIIYSDFVTKLNRVGKRQKRVLVITNKAIYNFLPRKYTKWKRRILLKDINAVTTTGVGEFVLHVPTEYDYRYHSVGREKLLTCLLQVYLSAMHKQLRRNYSRMYDLRHVVMTKNMNKRDKDKIAQLLLGLDHTVGSSSATTATTTTTAGKSSFTDLPNQQPCFILDGASNAGETTKIQRVFEPGVANDNSTPPPLPTAGAAPASLVHEQIGHVDDEEITWEPLEQQAADVQPLEQQAADVPVLLRKYVQANGHRQLVETHHQCMRELQIHFIFRVEAICWGDVWSA